MVCRIFAALGVPVYDADSAAKRLMNTEEVLKSAIIATFGAAAYLADGSLNRDFMTAQIIGNPQTAKQLEALVHPAVGRDFAAFVANFDKQNLENLEIKQKKYVLKEAALLYEAGSYKELDKIIVVVASLETRIARVLERDKHRSIEQIKAIIAKQMPDSEKVSRADFVIDNNGDRLLIPQVLEIHRQILR